MNFFVNSSLNDFSVMKITVSGCEHRLKHTIRDYETAVDFIFRASDPPLNLSDKLIPGAGKLKSKKKNFKLLDFLKKKNLLVI